MDRPDQTIAEDELAAFEALLQEALAHLYDLAYLERCGLAERLGLARRPRGGAELHRLLVVTIERLKPPRDVTPQATAWKTYRSLFLRYVRSLTAASVASELGLSPRQAQRVQRLAVREASTLLREHLPTTFPGSARLGSVLSADRPVHEVDLGMGQNPSMEAAIEAEIEDELPPILAADLEAVEPLSSTLRSAVETLSPVLGGRGVSIEHAVDPRVGEGGVSRIVARQVIVMLSLAILERARPRQVRVSAAPDPAGVRLIFAALRSPDVNAAPVGSDELGPRLQVARRLLAAIGGEVTVTEPRENASEVILEAVARLPLHPTRTVLVVEDNAQVVQLYRRYLGGSLYQVISATDADLAVDLARAHRPDLITLDVMMPRRDGWEILQALKVHPETRDLPVIVCSVLRERELALALGAADFLAKPVTQRALLDALNRAAKRR